VVFLRQHRIQLRPRGMAILFKGESATRRNTEKAAQRVLRHGLSSLAPINSRELNERMRSASTYNPPLTVALWHPFSFSLSQERVPFLSVSVRVSLSRVTAGAHFWGFVGFLIKGVAVTPTARIRDLPLIHQSSAYPLLTLRLERCVI